MAHPLPPPERKPKVRATTSFVGLRSFRPEVSPDGTWDWRACSHLTLASDQGADMLSSLHCVQFFPPLRLNAAVFYDPSHGANRDFWGCASECNVKPFLLCAMIIVNLAHGPDDTGLRFGQVRDTLQAHFQETSPLLSPVFQQLVGQMLRERSDEILPEEGEGREAALWRFLQEENFYKKKGCKVNIGRFFSLVAAGKVLAEQWACAQFQVTIPALELDMLTNKSLPHVRLQVSGADEATDANTTSRRKLAIDDRSLRSCGANALVLALAILSDHRHQRLLAIICRLSAPTVDWHGDSSRSLRDVAASRAWLMRQLRGGLAEHILQTWEVLGCQDFMRSSGFLPHSSEAIAKYSAEETIAENDLAQFAGQFALTMAKFRARRTLYLQNYPHMAIMLLGTEDEQREFLDAFAQDMQIFEALKSTDRPDAMASAMLSRSAFNTFSVQQVARCLAEANYIVTPEVKRFITARFSTIMQSQGVEDMNNYQKNAKQETNWGGRYRRPQTSLAITIRKATLQKVHRFKGLNYNIAKQKAIPRLEKHDLAALGAPSLPVKQIASVSARALYWSPVAENVGVPVADLAILRSRFEDGRLADMSGTWCGFFCESSHRVAFRRRGQRGGGSNEWMVGLWNFKDSGCLCWPASVVTVAGPAGLEYVELQRARRPCAIAILDLESWEGFHFEFRSWAWQVKHVPRAIRDLRPGIRAFRDGETMAIDRLSATQAWFQLSRSQLENIAGNLSIDLAGCTTIVDVAFAMTKTVLQCNDDDCFAILERRLARDGQEPQHYDELMGIDEAAQCLRDEDRGQIKEEQAKAQTYATQAQLFRHTYRAKRAASRPGAQHVKNVLSKYKGPKKLPLNYDHFDQRAARKYLPPDSYLWRARTSGSWNARHKTFPSKSCRDTAWGGEAGALVQCIRHCWEWFLDVNGLAPEQCPFKELWASDFSFGGLGRDRASSSQGTT